MFLCKLLLVVLAVGLTRCTKNETSIEPSTLDFSQPSASTENEISRADVEKRKAMERLKYLHIVKSEVKKSFSIPTEFLNKKLMTECIFRISEQGDILSLEIAHTSENELFDRSVLSTLKSLDRLPRPPRWLVGEPIAIKFHSY